MARAYGGPFAFAALLKVFADILQFAQPQYLRFLLSFIAEYQRDPGSTTPFRGFALCALMFISALVQSAILHQVMEHECDIHSLVTHRIPPVSTSNYALSLERACVQVW